MDYLFSILFYNVILLVILLLMQPLVRDIAVGFKYTISNFDERVDEGVFARRLAMVKDNQIESLAIFLPLVALLNWEDIEHSHLGVVGLIFLVARLVYAMVSLAGIPLARSLAWSIGFGSQVYLGWIVWGAS